MFRFENLEIWKKAAVITEEMFDLGERLDNQHKYKFAEQLRSAALSITNNIAEGSGSSSIREFKQFINFAHRSVSETANMLILCHRRRYVTDQEKLGYLNKLEEVSKMLIGFSRSLKVRLNAHSS